MFVCLIVDLSIEVMTFQSIRSWTGFNEEVDRLREIIKNDPLPSELLARFRAPEVEPEAATDSEAATLEWTEAQSDP